MLGRVVSPTPCFMPIAMSHRSVTQLRRNETRNCAARSRSKRKHGTMRAVCCPSKPPGFDRAPTNEEAGRPPDKRPWTEYDMNGTKQKKPPPKACECGPLLCVGPTCCIFELQWCKACGEDADRTCDVLCRCKAGRLKMCLCFGPQCNEPLCPGCCYKSTTANAKVSIAECCECDCCDACCSTRYAGCQICCFHCTCVRCMPCCVGLCFLGGEEMLMMDGDFRPLPKSPDLSKTVPGGPSVQEMSR